MRVVVLGATGLVGKVLVRQLLADDRVEAVRTLVRRPGGQRSCEGAVPLDERVVDFESPAQWQSLLEGDALCSAMGTTLKAAGSQDAQWRVDHDYQLWAARAASARGIRHYVLVSSTGANSSSPIFYSKMKGTLEEAVQRLPFRSVTILRPSLLDGDRQENRPAERWALRALGSLPPKMLPASLRPVAVTHVAEACRAAALRDGEGVEIWEAEQVRKKGQLPTKS